jgi:hypothetical protein
MGTQAQAVSVEETSPCIARQPILTAEESVVGYELFFREGPQNNSLLLIMRPQLPRPFKC